MHETLFFIITAYVSGTVLLLSLIELGLNVRRQRAERELQESIRKMKAHYNKSINDLVLTGDAKLEEVEKQVKEAGSTIIQEKSAIEQSYQEKIEAITKESDKALESAKARAKRLEQGAKEQADDYAQKRQKEVEAELMDLVIAVTRKVLPEGLTYDIQKELVMHALRDVQAQKVKG
jgi:flagellar biosynthesis/type III secretory pathway protein FliH